MRLGWTLSGLGHVALILVLLFGGLFWGDRFPETVSVSEVSVISEAEFAALALPGASPEPQTDIPDVEAPEANEEAPDAPSEEVAPTLPEASDVEVPEAPDTPDITVPEPVPGAVAVDTAPPVPVAPSELDGTSLERDAVAAPAPRVAAVPQVATPEREVAPDVVPDSAPEPTPEPEPEPEPEEPAAPEEASDRIVTEAEEEKTYAPASSMRPRSRPAQPVRRAETPREPEPETPSTNTDDAVAAALNDTQSETRAPSGPPLTGGEKDAFRFAVGDCWVVDSGGQSAGVKVTVAFTMNSDGTVAGDVRLVSAEGGNDTAQRTAFEKARRAILRCQRGGYPLPVEKYEQWREVEATFNPEGMQYR